MPTTPPLRLSRVAGLSALVAALLGGAVRAAEPPPAGTEGGTPFEAAWSATGRREVLRAGAREVVTIRLSGTLTVLRGDALGRGFRGEALFYSDGRDVHRGTLVLTDVRGDQLFADLAGLPSAGGAQVRGTILGGSGEHAGVSGDFAFRWRHLVQTPEGDVQGVAEDFAGRVRRPGPAPGSGR